MADINESEPSAEKQKRKDRKANRKIKKIWQNTSQKQKNDLLLEVLQELGYDID
jgi:hypothetical protein